ncbi:MAG: type I glyceraldehyde-3-phosphate dehydrogenase [Acidimicrobiales bacterium]|nr:type I glyceraldehyde-3-phosphate dehydrogenase [Acidimicrobiales bacterium]
MPVRIAVNGFGRIGRNFVRSFVERQGVGALDASIELVAVNDLGNVETLAHLLRHDSVHGAVDWPVGVHEDLLNIDGRKVSVLAERNPGDLPWDELGVDLVIESTGVFTAREDAALHLDAGARRVIVSAPAPGADATFVIGVIDDMFDPATHHVVSNASCTTNCLAPMVKVLDDAFGFEQGMITTVHAYTGDQALVDGPHSDLRRARAAAVNVVPTTTGAARAIGLVLPHLAGKLEGLAMRVPVPSGSVTDLVAKVGSSVSVAAVNEAFRAAAESRPLASVLEYREAPLVSSDIVGLPASCVFDADLTMVMGDTIKIAGWYDNEWGYSNRLVDLTTRVAG